ncbi:MAG: BadF/BadG/BcrA/BcrD ATPase family protein [Thiolinea sp.]
MMYSSQLYLGIDGGGSTCRARLSDAQANVVGEGFAGPANFRLGVAEVSQQIKAATQAALQQAGCAERPLDTLHAGLGLAGVVLPSDQQEAQPIKDLFAHCELSSDAYIACLGAHQAQPGGILILGTGSCAQIITPEVQRTYGGWGFAVADHSSGAWLGREAIRLSLLALEKVQPSTPLTEALNAQFDEQADHFLVWSLKAKPADYARFAPLVFTYAAEGDPHAKSLLQQACVDVSNFVNVLDRHQTGRITLLGGLAALYPAFLPAEINDKLCPAQGDALDGALLMARNQYRETAC